MFRSKLSTFFSLFVLNVSLFSILKLLVSSRWGLSTNMKLTYHNEIDTWPIPLGNSRVRRGYTNSKWAVLFLFFFGLPFVGIGINLAMIGTGRLKVEPSTVHVSYEILTLVGGTFAFAGLICWSLAVRQLMVISRHKAIKAAHYCEATTDYPWDRRKYTPGRWASALNGFVGSMFVAAITTILVYLELKTASLPWWVNIITVVFAFYTLWLCCDTAVKVRKAIKFGSSCIVFDSFPYRLNKPVTIKWQPPVGLTHANTGSFTLRCVEEDYVTTGRGEDSSTSFVHRELWRGTWLLNQPHPFYPGETDNFRYEAPSTLPSTKLSADKPVFWEFEIKLKTSGPDFVETYLVPIY